MYTYFNNAGVKGGSAKRIYRENHISIFQMHIMLSTCQYLATLFDLCTDEHIYCTVTIF